MIGHTQIHQVNIRSGKQPLVIIEDLRDMMATCIVKNARVGACGNRHPFGIPDFHVAAGAGFGEEACTDNADPDMFALGHVLYPCAGFTPTGDKSGISQPLLLPDSLR
jgi:hypothetical protein